MLAAATSTTISCSLGRQYKPVLKLPFFDVHGLMISCFYNLPKGRENFGLAGKNTEKIPL
jgi:hypothetical protein